MSYESNFDYNGDVSKIDKITFGIMSPELIRSQSVVQVIHHDTFCGNNPVTGGLFDPRMGVLEYGQICSTDGQTNKNTPGYFGHIELSIPIFHIQYFPIVQKVLRCVCYRCGDILYTKYDESIPHKARLTYLFDVSKKIKVCPTCKAQQPDKIVKTDLCKTHAVWMTNATTNDGTNTTAEVEDRKLNFTSKYVLNLFKQLSDDTCWKLGLNPKLSHPSWMIMTAFPVCPPACRPSVHQDNGQRMEDDITIKYCDIIKYNRLIRDKMLNDPDAKIIEDWSNLLQYHVSTLIDNEIAGVLPAAQRSGRPLKGLRQRLKGKEGRIRGNLMGKRVNFSSRTVITPDPIIDLDELGVPKKIAIQLTRPEKVTAMNITRLKGCIRNGCKIYPGARAVYKSKNNKTISLNHIDRVQFAQLLEIGDIVIRHITNGDWVLFNRQPSLHKMSMMAHRIRILDGLTFRLNISATTPYNADFDGDEMNMHVPQSIGASNEIACLASVNTQIVSPALNMPIITFVQDAVLGGHKMTMDIARKMTHREMMNALAWNKHFDGTLRDQEYFSGKEGLSFCIPDTTLRIKNRQGKYVNIQNGEVSNQSDVFDKKVFTSLIHSIFRDNGSKACAGFFNSAQHMIRSFILKNSFSVGVRDLILEDDLKVSIEGAIKQQILDAEKTIQTIHLNMFENMTSDNRQVAFESKVNQKLTAARSCAENILKKAHDNIQTNRFMNMVNGGSKGKLINLAQMTACLGQQAIDGRRVPYGFKFRTLPHFEKFDDKALARGFVSSSFQKGMNPLEFFFHAMAGREGIIDTAVKSVTWETPIVIIENNEPHYTEIGKWVDERLKESDDVEFHEERNLELLKTKDVFIPTTDYKGNVSWGEVTALTRHDPGEKLYEIKTTGGRKVTVTENKSLLIWKEDVKEFRETYSTDIAEGDCVPVTAELCKPPIIKHTVNLEKYFPKTEYIYGTDFNKALRLMDESMKGRIKIPSGWWNSMKDEFTLPFTKKSALQRCKANSNINLIKDSYIYSYHAKRNDMYFADKFQLNHENGIFIGLYLAEGNTYKSAACITNREPSIISFVQSWFTKFNIPYVNRERINKIGGVSSTTSGSCILLSRFLDQFVGRLAYNKYVPTEAFTAPEEFITGLLSGYFSGDGTIGRGTIEASSCSERLIEGISMLCNRIGIFGKMSKSQLKKNNFGTKSIKPTYRFAIRANWGNMFKEKITLVSERKQEKLIGMKFSEIHSNFPTKNNVVLDKIVEINIIGVEEHPKMYDLTIPSTLNFGLANGLQVRDTSSTGYIQRKLMKALEDYKISWSGNVKDAQDNVIQFLYGDDNTDGVAMEYQSVPIVDVKDIREEYFITSPHHDDSKMNDFCETLEEMYDWYVNDIFENSPENTIKFPIHIERTLQRIITKENNEKEPITPNFIIEKYENLLKEIQISNHNPGTWMVKFMLYIHAHPKRLISKLNIDKRQFLEFVKTFKTLFIRSRIESGDAVGPVAAQSIGEPCTQLSLSRTDKVLIQQNNKTKSIEIGKLIDEYLPPITNPESQHDVMEVSNLKCVGVSPKENVKWTNVTHISRHPANGDMITVITKSGKKVKATLAHSFLARKDNRVVPIEGYKLKIGDYVPCIQNLPRGFGELEEAPIPLNRATGRFIGAVVSEGIICTVRGNINSAITFCQAEREWIEDILQDFTKTTGLKHTITCKKQNSNIKHNHEYLYYGNVYSMKLANWMAANFGKTSHNKTLPAWILDAPDEFVSGLLQTAYDGDGNIEIKPRHHQIRYHSVSRELLVMMSMCLAKFGIPTSIQEEPGKKPSGEFRMIYVLRFPMGYVEKFNEHIGFFGEKKQSKLDELIKSRNEGEMRGNQFIIPETENIIKQVREHISDASIRKEMARVCRKKGVSLKMLTRIKEQAVEHNAPKNLIDELEQAIKADVFWDTITHLEIEKDSKEMVYDFTVNEELQSFALDNLLVVHNTLNSVTYDTDILVRNKNKEIQSIQIGDFVEKNIKKNPEKTQYYDEKDTTWTPILSNEYFEVPSVDENGVMGWKMIEAVTQHPVVNEDGSDVLLKITTKGKRTVTATKAKSFLQLIDGKVQEASGDNLKIGQHLLVSLMPIDGIEIKTPCHDDYESIYNVVDGISKKEKRNGRYKEMYFDEIESIEEVSNPTKYVYDLTVADTRNFNIQNGLCMRDTFHLSGVGSKSNITRGVPRLQELFHLSKNPKNPSLTIRLPGNKGHDKEHVQRVSADICLISIKNLLLNIQITYEPEEKPENLEFNEFERQFNELEEEPPVNHWVMTLSFDRKKILEMNICLEEIYHSIMTYYPTGVFCKYTDDNAKDIRMFIRIDKNNVELKKNIVPNVIPEITILNSICTHLTDDIIIRGIDKIENVTLRQDIRSQTNKEWLIDTDGSNIVDVILHPDVDANRTVSNDVIEMYQVFGVEAARQTLIREIKEVMDEASEIDPRHVHLLVDMMTTKGKLIPIDRNGMKLTNVGPLAKCSFEEADQQLYKAAIHGETDDITGVSSNIILGQAPPCGTGSVDVKLDEERIMELLKNSVSVIHKEDNIPQTTSVSFDFDD